jgi:hypothetical protein
MRNLVRHKSYLTIVALVCLAALGGASSCALLGIGGGGEGSWARAEKYSVTPDSSWKKRSPEDSDKAFQLPSGNIATVTSSCRRHPEASLELLTKHLLMGTRHVSIERRDSLKIGDSDALLTKLSASMEGAKFNMIVVVTRKSDCVFDFSLVSPKAIPSSDESEFLAFVRSLKNGTN